MDVLGLLAAAALTKEWVVDSPFGRGSRPKPAETLREQRVLKPLSNQQDVAQEFLLLTRESIAQVPPVHLLEVQSTSKQSTTEQNQPQNRGLALETPAQVPPVHQLEVQPTSEQLRTEQNQLHNRVEALETRTSDLEEEQFSPTAFLEGEVIWGVSGVSGRDRNDSVVFQESVELILNVSFMEEDSLEIGLESGNATEFSFVDVTFEGRLGFPASTDGDRFELSELSYEFPIGERASLYISTTGDDLDDFSPFVGDSVSADLSVRDDSDDDSSEGALSEFGAENPIHNLVEDTGVQINYDLTDALSLSLGYFSGEASNPEAGLFNGNQSAFVQVGFEPSNRFLLGLTYIYTYNDSSLATETGSLRSQINLERPVVGNSYGISISFAPTSRFAIGGWVGLTDATVIDLGSAEVWNYALTLALPDFGKENNLLGVVIGQEPKLTGTSDFLIDKRQSDPDTSLHIETFYQYQVTDQLSITPGLIWITAPNHDNGNPDFLVFTVRTTFKF